MKRRGFLKTVCGVIGAGLAWPLLGKGTAGPRDIVVRPGQTVRLPPGHHGTVTVMDGGTLVHSTEGRGVAIETLNLHAGSAVWLERLQNVPEIQAVPRDLVPFIDLRRG